MEHGPQSAALGREAVLVARRAFAVLHPLEDPVVDQGVETSREDVARDAQASLEVVEAPDPDEGIAQDQKGPPLAHDFEGLGDRTVHVLEGPTFHRHHPTSGFYD